MIIKICECCGVEFSFKSHGKKLNEERKFCSYKCSNYSKIGKSTWNKGLTNKNDERILSGEKHPLYGKPLSENHKQALSKNHADFSGKHSGSWRGGTWNYWKKQTLIRDDYTCQICGFRNVDIMIVDHKLPKCKYPELKFVLDNLQTLCPNCNQIKTIRELKNKEYR